MPQGCSARTPHGTVPSNQDPLVQQMRKALEIRGFFGGRYWDRTSDLFRVREARYRCANRPKPARWSANRPR